MARKKPKLPRTREPLPCVLLAVDPGSTSGFALFDHGKLVHSGACDINSYGVEDAVTLAISTAATRGLPLVLLTEEWGKGGARGIQQWGGLHGARKVWKREFEKDGRAAYDGGELKWVPKTTSIHLSTWRSFCGLHGLRKDAAKRAVIQRVQRVHGRTATHDEAEAICIGEWGTHAGEVAKLLPVRVMKAHGLREAS